MIESGLYISLGVNKMTLVLAKRNNLQQIDTSEIKKTSYFQGVIYLVKANFHVSQLIL